MARVLSRKPSYIHVSMYIASCDVSTCLFVVVMIITLNTVACYITNIIFPKKLKRISDKRFYFVHPFNLAMHCQLLSLANSIRFYYIGKCHSL